MNIDRELFMKKRILFVMKSCSHCAKWLEFIERVNTNMPLNKRIEVIDCSKWQETGIPDNFLIKQYARYIDGFPCLFFEGKKISGANSREELESSINVLCIDDFYYLPNITTSQGKSILFNKECRFKNTIWGRRIICK